MRWECVLGGHCSEAQPVCPCLSYLGCPTQTFPPPSLEGAGMCYQLWIRAEALLLVPVSMVTPAPPLLPSSGAFCLL